MKGFIIALIIGIAAVGITCAQQSNKTITPSPQPTEGKCDKVWLTITDMSYIGSALGFYLDKYEQYPDVKNIDELKKILEENNFIKDMATKDAWGTPLQYKLSSNTKEMPRNYFLISAGCDKKFDPDFTTAQASADCNADIIFRHGQLTRYLKECGSNIEKSREKAQTLLGGKNKK
jgi:hypothetical protein